MHLYLVVPKKKTQIKFSKARIERTDLQYTYASLYQLRRRFNFLKPL